ncbi:hypothetical protein AAKU55_002502 [Oxalobacteraceae bacterium GrIS 1.11]
MENRKFREYSFFSHAHLCGWLPRRIDAYRGFQKYGHLQQTRRPRGADVYGMGPSGIIHLRASRGAQAIHAKSRACGRSAWLARADIPRRRPSDAADRALIAYFHNALTLSGINATAPSTRAGSRYRRWINTDISKIRRFGMKNTKKIKTRIEIIDERKKSYLEFLRNLTPQIILLTLAFYLSERIDNGESEVLRIIVCVVFFAASVIAIYANHTTFYKTCFPEWGKWIERVHKRLKCRYKKDGIKGAIKFFLSTLELIRRSKFIETVGVFVAMNFSFILISAILFLSYTGGHDMWTKFNKSSIQSRTIISTTH